MLQEWDKISADEQMANDHCNDLPIRISGLPAID
jgi:hypothetical protein